MPAKRMIRNATGSFFVALNICVFYPNQCLFDNEKLRMADNAARVPAGSLKVA